VTLAYSNIQVIELDWPSPMTLGITLIISDTERSLSRIDPWLPALLCVGAARPYCRTRKNTSVEGKPFWAMDELTDH